MKEKLVSKVLSVNALSTGKVHVTMSDGRQGVLDVRPYMRSDFFRELEAHGSYKV